MSDLKLPSRVRVKSILFSSFAGIFCALLLGGVGIFLGSISADYLNISTREGEQGYFVLAVGLVTSPVGFLFGSLLTLYLAGHRRSRLFLALLGSIALTVGIIVAGFSGWYYFQPQALVTNGAAPKLYFEIKFPLEALELDHSNIRIDLNTDQNTMPAELELNSSASGSQLVTGYVELYFRTSSRMLILRLPNDEVRIFDLKLPSNVLGTKYHGWSEWYKADWLDKPGLDQPVKITQAPDYEIRYRVEENR